MNDLLKLTGVGQHVYYNVNQCKVRILAHSSVLAFVSINAETEKVVEIVFRSKVYWNQHENLLKDTRMVNLKVTM